MRKKSKTKVDNTKSTCPLQILDSNATKCEFCSASFTNVSEKNAHILQHFAQEFCTKCDQNLIQIASNVDDEIPETVETFIGVNEIDVKLEIHENSDIDQYDLNLPSDHDDFDRSSYHEESIFNEPECPLIGTVDDQLEKFTTKSEQIFLDATDDIDNDNDNDNDNDLLSVKNEPETITEDKSLQQAKQKLIEKKLFQKLKRRIWKNNYDATEVQCEFDGCNKWIKRRCIYRHMANHRQIRYICDICKQSLASKRGLTRHMQKHFPGERPICEVCGRTFATKQVLRKHCRKIHFMESQYVAEKNMNNILNFLKKQSAEIDERTLKKKRDSTKKHKATAETIKERRENRRIWKNKYDAEEIKCEFDGCNMMIKRRDKYKHMTKHQGLSFSCDVPMCPATFDTKIGLLRHAKRHTNREGAVVTQTIIEQADRKLQRRLWKNKYDDTLVQCEYDGCGEWIKRRSIYKHVAREHQGIEFICDICNASLTSKTGIRLHMERRHIPKKKKTNKCKPA